MHHGNGTQDIFYDDPSVLFFSTHQSYGADAAAKWEPRPGMGPQSTCLPPHVGDQGYLDAFQKILAPLADVSNRKSSCCPQVLTHTGWTH